MHCISDPMHWHNIRRGEGEGTLMNTVSLTQPHIKRHTLPASVNSSSTHFHSMKQWNRHLLKSLQTTEAEDRRERLSGNDGTLYLNHNHTHIYCQHSLSPFSYLSSSMHHSPSSLPLFSSRSPFTTQISQLVCKKKHTKKTCSSTGQGFIK